MTGGVLAAGALAGAALARAQAPEGAAAPCAASRAAAAASAARDRARADALEAALVEGLRAAARAAGLTVDVGDAPAGAAAGPTLRGPAEAVAALVALHARLDEAGLEASGPAGAPPEVRLARLGEGGAAAVVRCGASPTARVAALLRDGGGLARAALAELPALGVVLVAGTREGVAPTGLLLDAPRLEVWREGPEGRALRVRLGPLPAGAAPGDAGPRAPLADALARGPRAAALQALLAEACAGGPVEVVADAGGLSLAGPPALVDGLARLAVTLDEDPPGPGPRTVPLWEGRAALVFAEATPGAAEARFVALGQALPPRRPGPPRRGEARVAWCPAPPRVVVAGAPAELAALGR